MSVRNLGRNTWEVRVRHRQDGRILSRKSKVQGTKADAIRTEAQLIDELRNAVETSSLTIQTLDDALDYYQEHSESNLVPWTGVFNRLHREMGSVPIPELTERWAHYWKALRKERGQRTGELLKPKSLNNILCGARMSISLCVKHGLLEKNPLSVFEPLPAKPRDRVLSHEEESRLLDTLEGDWLYWPVRFALRNPIRKSDLFALTFENLDEITPCVHFQPSKTAKKQPRECFLHQFGDGMIQYWRSLPDDCPFLFPRFDAQGRWHKVRDPQSHWAAMRERAGLEDFKFHDLKHCSVTKMIDAGYSVFDLRSLGIQFSAKNVAVYYHYDARKVMQKHCGPLGVAPKAVSL